MNPNDERREEDRIASLLASTQNDAAAPDQEFLARLREQSTEAFLQASAPLVIRKRPVFARALRWTGTVAAAVLIGTGLYYWLAPGQSDVAFGKVLAKFNEAEALHLKLTHAGKTVEYWGALQPIRWRRDELNGKYLISHENVQWHVDEKANRAEAEKYPAGARAPWPPVNVMSVLGSLHGIDKSFENERPVERTERDGVAYLVYHTQRQLREPGTQVEVEALVNEATLVLHSIEATTTHDGMALVTSRLEVLGFNEPVPEGKFVVSDTLTEDGRIGKVTDVQGIVSVKPVLHQRWTPVRELLVLKPGDWLRTDARGANATAFRLVKQTGVILGPRTLVELIGPTRVRLVEGEMEMTVPQGAAVELLGPAGQKAVVKGKQFFRVRKDKLVRDGKEPPWLLGFKGTTANESLGSLVALVDGRNVPLTVGYHKVSVDIRDQIARTVIEESFVNHTDAQLEGVFYFPLPQDASISGFGMWIGDNLIEADVVEKQRAREIYETILREKRDPGLLEWSGGNIFKARVFPILAHSEKRIKITYTQVLPLKGSRYRYSYALQSELLQQHPLRELALDVKVSSVVPLKSVSSPTHPARTEQTRHSAHVEFTAQEYTPARDFEVVIEVDGRQSDVVMIPHRRGDDGYFMLQLMPQPTSPPGKGERLLVPDGEPVQLVVLADTSASIDAGQRTTQEKFIGSLLAALGPVDSFNLGTCDVGSDWVFTQPVPADAKNIARARDFLGKRTSLGWTNLDVAFAQALKQCGPKTHVIYVGDGIVTTGDGDPVAFTKRLRRLWDGFSIRSAAKDGLPIRPTMHAVSLGNSYEPVVLKAIASLGAGSLRKITSEQGPQAVALELLGEIALPALRDVKVEFKGVKVARVYPDELPNVPAGTQQIILGRYLPEGGDQAGEVIVTGKQGGKAVRFSTRVSLKDAEHGNSFIPRLWARMHLDNLLDQGSSSEIKDEIIALSEEYQIITPYTSFLVLETDADRERFKVKRRFQMRDGEKFFAEGRDKAVFDLRQKQMKKAGNWRVALRLSVLRQLAALGRDASVFQPRSPYRGRLGEVYWERGTGGDMKNFAGDVPLGDLGVPAPGMPESEILEQREGAPQLNELAELNSEADKKSAPGRELDEQVVRGEPVAEPALTSPAMPPSAEPLGDYFADDARAGRGLYPVGDLVFPGVDNDDDLRLGLLDFRRRSPYYGQWLNTLFPPLRPVPRKTKAAKTTWPGAARDLAQSLLRTGKLAKMTGGIKIVRQSESFDARWGDLTSRSHALELFSAKAWLTRAGREGGDALISWCDAKEYGIFSKAFQLGRVRAATPLDLQPPPLELSDHSLASLEDAYRDYVPTLERQGKDRTLLVLKYRSSNVYETRILIDTERHVILSIEDRFKGKITSATTFDDFIEAAGCWWARRIETKDANDNGKRLSRVTQTIQTLVAKELDEQVKQELAGRAQVQLLRLPPPTVSAAKKAVAAGKAKFKDHLVLLLHFSGSQQWVRTLDQLQQAEALAAAGTGMRWLRSAVLLDARRHEELRKRCQDDAARLAKANSDDDYFLAEHVVGQAAQVLEANEMLSLLDVLQPLYRRQPAHVQGRKRWQHLRVTYLVQAGRPAEALAIQKQLAAGYPHDYSLQQEYAQALAGAGDYPAAYAWLNRVLVKEARWLAHEEASLKTAYTQLLEQQGRYADLVAYLAGWVKENPEGRPAYDQYLSALIKSDQIEKADALMNQWLKEALVRGELAAPVEARLNAAVYMMLGSGHQFYTNHIEERWLAPLAQTALFFARHETEGSVADQIMSNYQFRRGDEYLRVRATIVKSLTAEIDKLSPEQVKRFVNWAQYDDSAPAVWKKIADGLRRRWLKEGEAQAKHTLGEALVSLLSSHGDAGEALAFLRLQAQKGPDAQRVEYANQLFDRLLEQPWSAAFEDEAFTLLDKLSAADETGRRLFASVAALHRLTDKMLDARFHALMKAVTHQEKLTRIELQKKKEENRRKAREGFADRLSKEAAKHPRALAQWLTAERLYVDVLLDRNLKEAAAECWRFLGAEPPTPKKAGIEPSVERVLEEILRHRYLVTLTNLAARKDAAPALVKRLLTYLDDGIRANTEDSRWKSFKYRLLIALDRPKELERALQQWVRQDDGDSRWRIALGYLLAEQGHVAGAIKQFEAVEAADELGPSAYRALAGWYTVQNQRSKYEKAFAAVYKSTDENRLSRTIAARLYPWQRQDRPLPTELDKEVLAMFAALFENSSSPQYYLSQLAQFYQACHDFRLLSVLADAVVGHSAAKVYPFLQGMQSVLSEIRDEATADELVQRISAVRQRAKTVVDRRALDLLEVLVERRAAEVQNQPGPHVDRAVKALVRAFKRAWTPGEPRLMADFLAGLGRISTPALAREQLRQLKILHGEAAPGSLDRLHIGHRYAATLHDSDSAAKAGAVDFLEAALKEFQDANDGVLPVSANGALGSFIQFLEAAGHFARGEKYLAAQLEHAVHEQQRIWLIERRNNLYHLALQNGGDVSLGAGLRLFHALEAKLQGGLAGADQNHRYRLLELLCRVYRTAHEKKLAGVVADLKAFAFKVAPPILKQQIVNYDTLVGTVAHTVYDLAGPRDGIAFLLNQAETEPRWLRYSSQDAWSRHASSIATWRVEAKALGDLEARLLRFVLAELRRDLATREAHSRVIYHKHNDGNRYWKEKEADFARVAEEVLAQRDQSGQAVQYIADYFYWGLGRGKRAIEILFVAYQQKLLDEAGQAKLIDFLQRENRHGEAIAVLLPLIERRPENLHYRVLLMHSYFRTSRHAELRALLKETDALFHQKDHWTESALASLAHSCLENELYEQSVAYYKELIPLHERTQPNRGIGNGRLTGYYSDLAYAYAGLKKTAEAVDAAGGAVVAWGARRDNRTQALETMRQVLLRAPDLDAFVAQFDKQKQDSAVIRKALGQAYHAKGEHAKAIKQLQLAAELQPNDAEIYHLLIEYCAKAGDKEGAIRHLLKAVQLSRRDIKLYQELGQRYQASAQPREAERAFTSIVEVLPAESESHALLAEIREKQNRWPEAIAQWTQVARIRALEPTGLLKLAAAQVHEKQWQEARETLGKLTSRSWPARFGDVQHQVRLLEDRLTKERNR